jgi:hypothetical protein
MTKTAEQKAREAEAERERAARRRKANARLAKLDPKTADAIRARATELEAKHFGAKRTAVAFLEDALDEHETKDEPAEPKRPKGPREKSTPKEKGRPKPQTKQAVDELAANAKKARGGEAGLAVTVAVAVPEGLAYCAKCDSQKPEADFWPEKRTERSHRRRICRPCYNAEWREWDQARRARKAAEQDAAAAS